MGLPQKGEGCGGIFSLEGRESPIIAWSVQWFSGHQTGVTEPPRLTSDPICTADRRGGILISCPTQSNRRTGINPLNPIRPCGVDRRGSRRASADGVQPPAVAECSSHYCLMRGLYLTSLISNEFRKIVEDMCDRLTTLARSGSV